VPDTEADLTMWTSLLHAGLAGSFLKLPHIAPDRDLLRQSGARAAIYGVPWDSTSISRTGANYGPRAIREISCQFLSYNATLDFDLVDTLAPVDCGDASVVLANAEKTFAAAQHDIGEIVDGGALPVILGGDHSVSIPAVRAVSERYDRPGLVLIDTHLDTATDVGGEELNHCCPVTRAIDAGFAGENVALIAINGWMNPRSELSYCYEHGITIVWLEEIWEKGSRCAVERALEVAGSNTDALYLSVDIDALDAAYAPGTCVPTPGGLTAREMIELVRGISAHGLAGVDVVETAPSLDATTATSGMAARLAIEAMAFHGGARLPA
jgi:agmatinase